VIRVGLEWGQWAVPGLLDRPMPSVVVVDVLSFTTALSVAMDLGTEVLPHPWEPSTATERAEQLGATLAVPRSKAGRTGAPSLSPAGLRRSTGVSRLFLPSPNGSAICHRLATAPWRSPDERPAVIGASLRNASAVAQWLRSHGAEQVLVIPAGERWPDGSMRPAVEDLLGSGAVIDALAASGETDTTADAAAALAAFRDARPELLARLRDCPSGRELTGQGFADDVEIAAELDTSSWVPLLDGATFRGVVA
jgi:2-phosphosulfolactate phosphatase